MCIDTAIFHLSE
jgi:hypothetical protein